MATSDPSTLTNVVQPSSAMGLVQQLKGQLESLMFNSSPKFRFGSDSPIMDEAENPNLAPMLWISKWVDHANAYGMAYQLSDDCVGFSFIDSTYVMLLPNGHDVHYVDRQFNEHYFTTQMYPPTLNKKMKVVYQFKGYMDQRLVKAGSKFVTGEGDALARYPYLLIWMRTDEFILMILTNGTVQMNSLKNHDKIIMCPAMRAVTYLKGTEVFRTYSFSGLAETGCSVELFNYMKTAYGRLEKILAHLTQNPNGPRIGC